MPKEPLNIDDEIAHLFKNEYGKIVSVLTKTFGPTNIELAEDTVQEALLEALKQWTDKGIPDNPVGWIYQVAKYKALNIVNHEQHKQKYTSDVAKHLQSNWTFEPALNHIFTENEIADDQLRMMFTCCHPSISKDSQVALTLKTLCGFSIPEIAKAFLTNEENINKRLVRARRNIRLAEIPFEVSVGKDLKLRLDSVLETIYLLFNEGYDSSSENELIRLELSEEAIRLAELLASSSIIANKSTIYATLSLMTLNVARFKSRNDEKGNFIDLEHQDRKNWDATLIRKGLVYLELATVQNEVSKYHILATISAHHCTAVNFESTDWHSILSLYNNLSQIDNSPIVSLNKAIALSKIKGPDKALDFLKNISHKETLLSYLPYYTTLAELHFLNQNTKQATNTLQAALQLPIPEKNKQHIYDKMKKYSKKK